MICVILWLINKMTENLKLINILFVYKIEFFDAEEDKKRKLDKYDIPESMDIEDTDNIFWNAYEGYESLNYEDV